MTVLKENLVPTLLILLAGLLVSLAAVPLQNTEWADGIRSGVSEGGEVVEAADAEGSEGNAPSPVFVVVAPLIKVTLLMGIGGLLTALTLWIIGRIKRQKVPKKA